MIEGYHYGELGITRHMFDEMSVCYSLELFITGHNQMGSMYSLLIFNEKPRDAFTGGWCIVKLGMHGCEMT